MNCFRLILQNWLSRSCIIPRASSPFERGPKQNVNHCYIKQAECFKSIFLICIQIRLFIVLNIQPLKLVQVLEHARQQDWYLVMAQIPARGERRVGCECCVFGFIYISFRIMKPSKTEDITHTIDLLFIWVHVYSRVRVGSDWNKKKDFLPFE